MRRRTLITSPLSWQMRAAPVSPPLVPVLAERGGTQLNAPQAKILVDSREQNPFDFSPVQGWFSGVEKKALRLGDYSVAGLETVALSNARTCPTSSTPLQLNGLNSCAGSA
jgi:hypothetical protein